MIEQTVTVIVMLSVCLFVDYYHVLPLNVTIIVIIYLLLTYVIKKLVTQYCKQSNRVTEHNNIFNTIIVSIYC